MKTFPGTITELLNWLETFRLVKATASSLVITTSSSSNALSNSNPSSSSITSSSILPPIPIDAQNSKLLTDDIWAPEKVSHLLGRYRHHNDNPIL